MQDKLIEAAQEVEGPFIVESEGRGSDKCGAGEFWNVVFKPEDVALSTAYGDKEEAEDLAEDLNNAFRKGVSSVRAHDGGRAIAPPIPFEDWWASQGKFIDPDTEDVPWFDKRKGLAEAAYDAGQSSVKFGQFYSHTKAASTPQQDAEDPAEPGEHGPQGYYSLEAVEKAIRWQMEIDGWGVGPSRALAQRIRARLAPKPSPLSTGYTGGITPEAYGVRCNRCGVFVDDQIMHDQWHAALFPKTGGAK